VSSAVPITTQDLAEHLGMTGDAPADLQLFLDAAIKVVEGRCGPLEQRPVTLRCRPNGRNLVLPATNLLQVSAVRDPSGQTVDVTAADVNLLAGIVPVPCVRPGWWEVDVVTGNTETPPDLKLAVFVVASHLYELKRGRAGRPQAYFGGENSDTQDVPRGFAVPARAAELMRPYVIPAFA